MDNTTKYIAKSFFWGVSSRLLDAMVKFLTVPLLLAYFGKENFALISLATSVNAYMNLLDMGVNTGATKYFSEWIGAGKMTLVHNVARTSISFYGAIGIINAVLLIGISIYGMGIFSITSEQAAVLHDLLLVLAFFAVINWSTSVFNQLLTANESIYYIHQINILKAILGIAVIAATIFLKWSLTTYFISYTIGNSIVLLPFYFLAKKEHLISSVMPSLEWKNFNVILKYSLAIIAMGIFQVSASTLRPIILAIFSPDGIALLADYRVMETITIFIISVGGMFTSIFLPSTTKLLLENNKDKVKFFAYEATVYTSVICVALCLPIVLCAREIISIYVGESFVYLVPWLILWVITILFFLHSTPVSSIILSTGKTRPLVISTALSCLVSLLINAIFCKQLGVGSTVLGYSVYIGIQMSFYYFYFNKKILGLNSWKVFKSFATPALLGFLSLLAIWLLNIQMENLVIQILVKCSLWTVFYFILLIFTKTIYLNTLKTLLYGKK